MKKVFGNIMDSVFICGKHPPAHCKVKHFENSGLYVPMKIDVKEKIKYILCNQQAILNHLRNECSPQQFECSDGTCISDVYQCDGKYDCHNGEDEKLCAPVCSISSRSWNSTDLCKGRICQPSQCQCGLLYLASYELGCINIRDAKHGKIRDVPSAKPMFSCTNEKVIPFSKVNDLIPDCEDGDDEYEYKMVLNNMAATETGHHISGCAYQHEAPCIDLKLTHQPIVQSFLVHSNKLQYIQKIMKIETNGNMRDINIL